ncbi:MAG: 50S ribosomal protein L10 [Anaerolineae bacterium]
MPLTREQKEERLKQYVEALERSRAVVFADYRGLRVTEMQQLRSRLREREAAFQVVKNTLFRMALEQKGVQVPAPVFQGTLAAAFAFGDPVGVAKVLTDFARDTKILQVRGALLGERFVDAAGVESLSTLPSREVLLAQMLGAFQAPIVGLVNVLAGPLRGLANVLNARADQLREAA